MPLSLGSPERHFFLTRSVARVMGVNLAEAIRDGRLAPETYAGMVTRCQGCALVTACEQWLASQFAESSAPPPGCWHSETLTQLRRPH
ncbi:DUF6455 family protein [Antarctobacter jejuensis]|uniref:DUF6455 family protein n=1 Tax=Antarctobacter jejuensis TaxID=1439938 RepID=UPI003FCFA60A